MIQRNNVIYLTILFFIILLNYELIDSASPKERHCYEQIRTAQGIVQGTRKTAANARNQTNLAGTSYYEFLGIPYAEPPVGPFRYKDPQPPKPWKTVRNATIPGSVCLQSFSNIEGDEDCLYINVYTPELPRDCSVLKPVMVWIHGGAFKIGNGYEFGPDFLISRDVVLVTFNYRLGVFGFLSLEDDILSGNYGLKDQVQALRWVQENINSFGGDPDKVTIFGESAGGASVHYHLLSPLSRGLFHKAIVMSGTALGPWAHNPSPKSTAIGTAREMGFNLTDPKSLYDFFMKVPGHNLTQASDRFLYKQILDIRDLNAAIYVPCTEVGERGMKFITKSAKEILQERSFAKVPVIFGTLDADGSVVMGAIRLTAYNFEVLNNYSDWAVPRFWEIPPGLEKDQLGQKIKQYFFNGQQVSWKTAQSLMDYFTDTYFVMDTQQSLTTFLKYSNAPVYNYEFTLEISNSTKKYIAEVQNQTLNLKGAAHGDELYTLFYFSQNLNKTESKVSNIMTRMWTNFAKTGNPNYNGLQVHWKPSSKKQPTYLKIDSLLKVKKGKVLQERMKFWREVCETATTKYNCKNL